MKIHKIDINTKTKKYSIFIGSKLISKYNMKYSKNKNFKSMTLPGLFEKMLENKENISVLYVAGQWINVNDAFDLAEARKVSWAKSFK